MRTLALMAVMAVIVLPACKCGPVKPANKAATMAETPKKPAVKAGPAKPKSVEPAPAPTPQKASKTPKKRFWRPKKAVVPAPPPVIEPPKTETPVPPPTPKAELPVPVVPPPLAVPEPTPVKKTVARVYIDQWWLVRSPVGGVHDIIAFTFVVKNTASREVNVKVVCHLRDSDELFGESFSHSISAHDDAKIMVRGFHRCPSLRGAIQMDCHASLDCHVEPVK